MRGWRYERLLKCFPDFLLNKNDGEYKISPAWCSFIIEDPNNTQCACVEGKGTYCARKLWTQNVCAEGSPVFDWLTRVFSRMILWTPCKTYCACVMAKEIYSASKSRTQCVCSGKFSSFLTKFEVFKNNFEATLIQISCEILIHLSTHAY